MQPTPEQIEAYQRDGFLVVAQLPDARRARARARALRARFAHEWETGLAPDEVNYTPASRRPTGRGSSATCGRPIARSRARCSRGATRAFAARARRRAGHAAAAGQRDLEAAVGQGAARPPGRRVPRLARRRRT